jgi:hypothetical protein
VFLCSGNSLTACVVLDSSGEIRDSSKLCNLQNCI